MTKLSKLKIPLFTSRVSAGIPFHGDTHVDTYLDLNTHLISHPAATFFVRVDGQSMTNAAILQGDILIVDRALKPNNNSIVVACLNGEFTVKRMRMKGKSVTLVPENAEFKPIPITDQMEFEIWGVVTYVIHNLCQSR